MSESVIVSRALWALFFRSASDKLHERGFANVGDDDETGAH